MHRHNFVFFIWILIISTGCAPKLATQQTSGGPQLKLLDVYVIPHNYKFQNTLVGGLSGIDYNNNTGDYYILSDERSATSPSRFYTAKIDIQKNKISGVNFTSVQTLKQRNGTTFPSIKDDPLHAADPESIRYNAKKNNLTWSSEGDKAVRNGENILQDPYIYEMDLNGNFSDSFAIPEMMKMKPGEAGPRTNGVFEGLAFDQDYKQLYVTTEEPLFDDGARADLDYAGAPVRITKFDAATKKPIAQYAYPLEAIARKPLLPNAFKINGASEILWYNKDQLLVIERSFSTGILSCTIKIFLADLSEASDVLSVTSLKDQNTYKPIKKKLLLNMDSLGRFIDNIEGITFGPILPNGKRSLILISDNNFQKLEKNQVFLFEVTE